MHILFQGAQQSKTEDYVIAVIFCWYPTPYCPLAAPLRKLTAVKCWPLLKWNILDRWSGIKYLLSIVCVVLFPFFCTGKCPDYCCSLLLYCVLRRCGITWLLFQAWKSNTAAILSRIYHDAFSLILRKVSLPIAVPFILVLDKTQK